MRSYMLITQFQKLDAQAAAANTCILTDDAQFVDQITQSIPI